MSELENKSSAESAASAGAADCLQKQINVLLLGMIVLSATFAVFLWRQKSYLRYDVEIVKPTYVLAEKTYAKERPEVEAFAAKLAEYARTHPDFAPLAQKYQLQGATNAAPATAKPAAPATNKPAPIPAPKK